MIGVLIVPTGIEAEIGGHAGDANPVAKLMASCFDILITHPNVLNASDINEMTENTLYVEGSVLNRFLDGSIKLKEVKKNKILIVANKPIRNDTVNAVSAARVTIGIEAEIIELELPFEMKARIENGKATGDVYGWKELIAQVKHEDFDALAIHTPIDVDREVALNYYRSGGVNPWGGVEAKASKLVADGLDKPVAHAPLETCLDDEELFNIFLEVVDPRIAPEAISICYLHSVLKGLHKAPRLSQEGICSDDVDFMISPYGCWGTPHEICFHKNIPIIIVKENKTIETEAIPQCEGVIMVENYWEAVGVVMSLRAGILPESVRRPIKATKIKRLIS